MTMAMRETWELSQNTVPCLSLLATEGKRNGAPNFGSLWPHYPHHPHIFRHGATGKDLVDSILNLAKPEKWEETRDQGLKHGSAATMKGGLDGKE